MRNLKLIALVLGSVISIGLARAQVPSGSGAAEPPSFQLQEFGITPAPAPHQMLLQMAAVQEELKMTEAQKKGQEATFLALRNKIQKARRDTANRQKFQETRDTIFKEMQAALRENLEPSQRERLDQIQLQAQGPLAFDRSEFPQFASVGPELSQRLEMSQDQIQKVKKIVEQGQAEIQKAAAFPIVLDSQPGPPTLEMIDKLVASPEFQAAKQKAREAGRNTRAAVMRRIEAVLSESQRSAYQKMLGQPYDLSKIHWWQSESQFDRNLVASALGLGGQGGGQRADPNFNTKVARPAYINAARHPRVLFDEAHHNFHTASGRYKPFADLITNDGYQVIPNQEKFTKVVLQKGDILVIANALGAEGMGQPDAANPAFTDAECDAVRDWVKLGGSLLFITDHAPMGSAAECLAKRFGVNMSKGATGDAVNSEGGETSLVFTRQNHLLGDHAITRGRDESERVNRVQTFTGTSLKGPEGSVPILKLADTALDYSFNDDKPVSAAGRAQGLALTYGKGRVVVLGEAAELSAQLIGSEPFGMNVPGLDNRKMALNVMHWLSGLLDAPAGALKKAG
jgi:hypothetical protein